MKQIFQAFLITFILILNSVAQAKSSRPTDQITDSQRAKIFSAFMVYDDNPFPTYTGTSLQDEQLGAIRKALVQVPDFSEDAAKASNDEILKFAKYFSALQKGERSEVAAVTYGLYSPSGTPTAHNPFPVRLIKIFNATGTSVDEMRSITGVSRAPGYEIRVIGGSN